VPLTLPNLDDLRWQDLIAEARAMLPASAPAWTNHNPSDPGITLIELFAYLSEKLMYQINRVTDADFLEFVSLIQGPDWKLGKGFAEGDVSSPEFRLALRAAVSNQEKRRILMDLQRPVRAVTREDFELLACSVPNVSRATCIPQRNLENDDSALRKAAVPGHVSVVVLAQENVHATRELLARIRQALEPARLLTTRVHVVAPRYVGVGVRIAINPARDVHRERLREQVVERIATFLNPHRGWFDRKGWPWGRSVYVSELYQLLAEIRGVDRVAPARDANGVQLDEIVIEPSLASRLKRNERGSLEEVALERDELFEPHIDPANVVIAASF